MIDGCTQSHTQLNNNLLINSHNLIVFNKKKQQLPFSSFQTHLESAGGTVYCPFRKNYLLTNMNLDDKSNVFRSSHVGLSRLNHTTVHSKDRGYCNLKHRRSNLFQQEVDSIVEKLLEDNEPNEVQVETEPTDEELKQEDLKKMEEKRLKLLHDIHPKEYIQEAFTTESENSGAFKSYKLQLNSLGNDYNRKNVLNGVNGYHMNTVKYKTLTTSRMSRNIDKENKKALVESLNLDKEKEKDFFFGNVAMRNKKRVKLNYVEKITLPDIQYIESMEEKVNEAVKNAFDTSVALKKRSELFRRKQKDYLTSIKKVIC